jgi:hypothetical protein
MAGVSRAAQSIVGGGAVSVFFTGIGASVAGSGFDSCWLVSVGLLEELLQLVITNKARANRLAREGRLRFMGNGI